jgi:hypothetical protein
MKQSHSDASLLKNLAIAFGDGLAFGVGMKIAQVSSKSRSPERPALMQPLPERPATPAGSHLGLATGESLDAQVFQKIVSSLEARLAEHLGTVDRRLAETEAQIALDLKGVDARDATSHEALRDEMAAGDLGNGRRVDEMEQYLVNMRPALEAKIAERVSATLEARIQGYIDARIHALEGRLHVDITEAGSRTAELLVETIETRLLQRIGVLEAAVVRQAQTIESLRTRSSGSEQKLHELLAGFSQACEQAIRELEEPVDEVEARKQDPPDDPGGLVPAEDGVEARAADNGIPDGSDRRFDSLKLVNGQPSEERRWPIPLVSTVAFTVLVTGVLQFWKLF